MTTSTGGEMYLQQNTIEAPKILQKPHQLPIVPNKKTKKLSMNEIRNEDSYQGQGELYAWIAP